MSDNVEVMPPDDEEQQSQEEPQIDLSKIIDPKTIKAFQEFIVSIMAETRKKEMGMGFIALGLLLIVVVAIVWLATCGKLTPSAGVILGSLAGYLFGSRD